jgi:hypothetical protein
LKIIVWRNKLELDLVMMTLLGKRRELVGLLTFILLIGSAECFALRVSSSAALTALRRLSASKLYSTISNNDNQGASTWDGSVVSNAEGKIRGCSLQQVEGSVVEWILTIDGVEADLGRFSEAIYKKIVTDAKKENFQGFRPGTIPPQLEPTYRAFAMDECARETVLEALQQNKVRPFESCRQDMLLESFTIPPAVAKPTKKKATKKKKQPVAVEPEPDDTVMVAEVETPPEWRVFDTMKEAIDAGWRPGQSFSFVAKGVKGQMVKEDAPATGSLPLGIGRS